MKKYVGVSFSTSPFKTYQFVTDIEGLKQGDQVVVDTVNGLSVAEVQGYEDKKTIIKDFKWIVQKIDLASHQERVVKNRRAAALKRKMESRRQELEEVQIYALLAREDESMREIFEEFLELSK